MIGLKEIIQLYLVNQGATHITLRSGAVEADDVNMDLSGVLPYLALEAQIASKILLGMDALDLNVKVEKHRLCVSFEGLPTVKNMNAAFYGVAVALRGCESGNLIAIEDEITDFILKSNGVVDVQKHVNNAFLSAYEDRLFNLAKTPNRSIEQTNATDFGLGVR